MLITTQSRMSVFESSFDAIVSYMTRWGCAPSTDVSGHQKAQYLSSLFYVKAFLILQVFNAHDVEKLMFIKSISYILAIFLHPRCTRVDRLSARGRAVFDARSRGDATI